MAARRRSGTGIAVFAGAVLLLASCGDASGPDYGPPSQIQVVTGSGQQGQVGSELGSRLEVRVLDARGRTVPDVFITWQVVSGEGSLVVESSKTGEDGTAAARWVLGPRAGSQSARASITAAVQVPPATFSATALPGPPAQLDIVSGHDQSGDPGETLPEPLVVRVADAYDNPVPGVVVNWSTITGGGFVSPASSTTNEQGLASTQWTLGPTAGQNVARAVVGSLQSDQFLATAGFIFNIRIEGAYFTQATQTFDGTVPLVAGRDAVLRVFAVANAQNDVAPPVRVRLYHSGVEITAPYDIAAPGASMPTFVNEGSLASSWNLFVPGDLVQPGLSFLVELDPEETVSEEVRADNVFPPSGSPRPVEVRNVPVFRVLFVPIHSMPNGLTGNVHAGNAEQYLSMARKALPLRDIEWDLRPPFSVDTVFDKSRGWEVAVQALSVARELEEADPTRHWFGVVRTSCTGQCTAGIAYVGGRTALGWDIQASAPRIAAHEWGHNFGRPHAPCGVSGEPSYPYSDASIGRYGLDVEQGIVFAPAPPGGSGYRDVMSYCTPQWVSDYTYRRVMDFRGVSGAEEFLPGEGDTGGIPLAGTIGGGPAGAFALSAAARTAGAAAPQPVLMVWGRIDGGDVVLEPAFRANALPRLPAEPGPYRLEGRDEAGTLLFSFSFAGDELADADRDVRHFMFAVPESMARTDRLSTLRVVAGGRERVRLSTPAAAAPAPPVQPPGLQRRAGGRAVEVSWDAARYPLVVLRDPASGRVLSISRRGAITLPDAPDEVEAILSDGVRSWSRRITVQR